MRGDLRIEQLGPNSLEALESTTLVRPNQPRVARHIGGEDRGETAGLAYDGSPAAKRSL
jgi:hypothetical protein